MTLNWESKYFLIVSKILGTIILLGMIFLWSLFLIVFLPMIMIVINHNRSQKTNPINLSIMMFPAAVCALLVWRVWYPRWNPNTIDLQNSRIRKVIPAPIMKRVYRSEK